MRGPEDPVCHNGRFGPRTGSAGGEKGRIDKAKAFSIFRPALVPLNGSRGFNLSDLSGSNTILSIRVTYLKVGNWTDGYKVIENSYKIAYAP